MAERDRPAIEARRRKERSDRFVRDLRKYEKPPANANIREGEGPGKLIDRPETQSYSDNPLNWS